MVIYDSYGLKGLRRSGYRIRDGDYRTYHARWMEFFVGEEIQDQIRDACDWLPNSHYAAALIDKGVSTGPEIAAWANEEWFRNRVLDQRLVIRGNPAGEDAVHPADHARLIGPGEV